MRLIFHVPTEQLDVSVPTTPEETERLVQQLRAALGKAGFDTRVGYDTAVVEEEDEEPYLTPEEREDGGFTFPEVYVDGAAGICLSVLKREVFFYSDGGFGDEQACAVEVVRVVRGLDGTIPVPQDVLEGMYQSADRLAVNRDGTVRRPVISTSQQSDRAIALFDRVRAPELQRPTAAAFEDEHFARLREMTFDAEPFRAALAVDPSGRATKMATPSALYDPTTREDHSRDLQDEMGAVLKEAIRQPWQATGLPTGLEARFDGTRLQPRLLFDTPVDAGSVDEEARGERARSAPFAWEQIAIAAAKRDPRFQPTWLSGALEIIAAGGRDVAVNRDRIASPDDVPPRSLTDRLLSRSPRRRQ